MMRLASLLGIRTRGGGLARYLPAQSIGTTPMSNVFVRDVLRLFDKGEPRSLRYDRYWNYYTGDMYTKQALADRARESAATGGKDYSAQLRQLYAFTNVFYNPVTQAVDMDVDTVFREPTRMAADTAE